MSTQSVQSIHSTPGAPTGQAANGAKGTALITGASTGIGALYADRLARRGYDLILVARNRERLDQLARQIINESHRSVEVIAADLNDASDLAIIETRLRTDAGVTLLVNNAGVGAASPLLASDVDAMDSMISLNVTALTRLAYAAVPGFVARANGAIINIASVVALAPDMLNGVYGATKAFVLAFSQSLQHELADKHVRVQVVLPGAIATPFWGLAGLPVENLPESMVMSAEDLVDAALVGFDLGEAVTLPSLPDAQQWTAYDAARIALRPNLSLKTPAARYLGSARAAA
jgi:short-subunit dehydrogenase